MKSTLNEPTPTRRDLEVEVPAEEVRREMDRAARRYAREVSLPGFRKGKTPASLVRKRFGKEIEAEVIERLASEYIWQVIEEKELVPVTQPRVEDTSYREGEPLTLRTSFEIRPRFTLGQYKGLEAIRKLPPVDDELVDQHLEALRDRNARLQTVEDRPLAGGDVPLVDLQRLGPDGEPEGEPQEGTGLDLRVDSSPPELRDGLAGMNVGETREVTIPPPDPAGGEGEARPPMRLRVTLRAVRERVLPKLDDEFARDVGDFEDLAALRAKLREDLERRAEERAESDIREQLLEQLVAAHSFSPPEVMVEHEAGRMLERLAEAMVSQGVDPRGAGVDWEKKRAELREPAGKRVQADLILDDVARAEELTITDAEVLGALQHEASRAGTTPAELKRRLDGEGRLNSLKIKMLRDKALDLIRGSANIIR